MIAKMTLMAAIRQRPQAGAHLGELALLVGRDVAAQRRPVGCIDVVGQAELDLAALGPGEEDR